MAQAFAAWPEALPTSMEIAERSSIELELGKMLIPRFPTPNGEEEGDYLRRLAEEGLRRRYGDPVPAEARERVDMELEVIGRMGFDAYFLIVWDFVKYAKDNGIAVGPGRGSAAGSIVSYALSITDVDPLAYDLLFERFLNAERVSMPDIDIDFSVKGRDRVIRYVADKYGQESVAQIITFGRMFPRAATRDAARVRGYDYAAGDRIAKLIPEPVMGRSESFDNYLKQEPELRKVYDSEPQAREIIETAKGLEGIVRNSSIHAAAVVIADRPLTDLVPLQLADAGVGEDGEKAYRTVTQYAMGPIEEIGLLKMDFLGLRNLDVIEAALDIIGKSTGERPSMETLPLDDAKTYEMLQRGDSVGVFQFESDGMQDALRKVKPTEFEDLVALVALYRPGAMRHIDTYARNKRNPDAIQYTDERLRPITESSYGVILYQEQSMQIAKEIAGFSGPEADDLRKAIGKKLRDKMALLKDRFVEGARASGTSEPVIQELWETNEAAADYSFNKAHAACYGLIAYRTAWLKANYPAEYMAALISSVMSTKDKVPFFVSRCEEMGIEVLPPDVNESGHDFVVSGGNIRFGLDAVKNVGLRRGGGHRRGAPGGRRLHLDLGLLPPGRLPRGEQEGDRVTGALRRAGLQRRHAHRHARGAARRAGRRGRSSSRTPSWARARSSTSRSRRRAAATPAHQDLPVPPLPDDRKELNLMEKETLGLFLSTHPLKEVRAALRAKVDCSLPELEGKKDGEWVTVGGMVAEVKKIRTRKGDPMMFCTLDDLEGQVEMIVFNSALEKHEGKLDGDRVVLVRARVDKKESNEVKLVAQDVEVFEPTPEEVEKAAAQAAVAAVPERLTLYVSARGARLVHRGAARGGGDLSRRAGADAAGGRAQPAARARLPRVWRRRVLAAAWTNWRARLA